MRRLCAERVIIVELMLALEQVSVWTETAVSEMYGVP